MLTDTYNNNLSGKNTLVEILWRGAIARKDYFLALFHCYWLKHASSILDQFQKLLSKLVTETQEYGTIWSRSKNTEVTQLSQKKLKMCVLSNCGSIVLEVESLEFD